FRSWGWASVRLPGPAVLAAERQGFRHGVIQRQGLRDRWTQRARLRGGITRTCRHSDLGAAILALCPLPCKFEGCPHRRAALGAGEVDSVGLAHRIALPRRTTPLSSPARLSGLRGLRKQSGGPGLLQRMVRRAFSPRRRSAGGTAGRAAPAPRRLGSTTPAARRTPGAAPLATPTACRAT